MQACIVLYNIVDCLCVPCELEIDKICVYIYEKKHLINRHTQFKLESLAKLMKIE